MQLKPHKITPLHKAIYTPILEAAFKEDFGTAGDLTSQYTIPKAQKAQATFIAREDGIIVGLEIAKMAFEMVDASLCFTAFITDGSPIQKGQALAEVRGNAQAILMAERVALNVLTHLSGIATQTQKMVAATAGTKAKVLDTRKTLPGLRALQKYAVHCGGGHNHRMGLYDMIMIKDNHIAFAGGLKKALEAAKANRPKGIKIEVEVDTIKQLKMLLDLGGADVVLLDNMPPKVLKKAIQMVKQSGQNLKTEASGNITSKTIRAVAESGVDYISSGALTHSVKNFDIGLDIL